MPTIQECENLLLQMQDYETKASNAMQIHKGVYDVDEDNHLLLGSFAQNVTTLQNLQSEYKTTILPAITKIQPAPDTPVDHEVQQKLTTIKEKDESIQHTLEQNIKSAQKTLENQKELVLFLEQQQLRNKTLSSLQSSDANQALIYHQFLQAKIEVQDETYKGMLQAIDLKIANAYSHQTYLDVYQKAKEAALAARTQLITQLENQATPDKQLLIQTYTGGKEPYFSPLLAETDYEKSDFMEKDMKLSELITPFTQALLKAQEIRYKVIKALQSKKATLQQKTESIKNYNNVKNMAPFESTLIHASDKSQFLDPLDAIIKTEITQIEKAIAIDKESKLRTKLLAAKVTPALTAMKTKLDELTKRFAAAKQQLFDKGGSQSSRVYNELLKASEGAKSLYEGLEKLHQQFINVEIDLATFKDKSKAVVAKTKWQNIEPAEKILAEHRRTATGGRTFKQMARDYLNSFGSLGEWLANSLFGKTKAHGTLYKVTEAIAKLTEPKKP